MSRARPAAFWTALAAGLLAAAVPLLKPGARAPFALDEFASLPVLEGGRVKPLDSFARNALLMMRGQQTVPVDGRRMEAAEWLADVLFRPEAADTYKVFAIDSPDLRGLLGLPPGGERRFAYWQLEPKREELRQQAEAASKLEAARRSRFQTAVYNLDRRLELYERAKNTVMVSGSADPAAELAAFSDSVPRALRAVYGRGGGSAEDKRAVKLLAGLLERYRFLSQAAAFRPLAPRASEPPEAWSSVGEIVLRPAGPHGPHPGLASWALLARAYRSSDWRAAGQSLAELSSWNREQRPAETARARAERLFNRAQPFVAGMALYVAALIAIFAWWGLRRPWLGSAALGLLASAAAVHTAGLLARVALQGRPPVTNLYSSAVFVGWIGALLGLAMERAHRRGFAAAAGALLGFCTLLVAHHLTGSGDTLEMMRAVLDSNFWLATHVVAITIGYGGTFLAGALGIAWVLRRHLVSRPDPEDSKALVALCYGVVAFSLLFSFVGTMLGGIWADQSWGRFWGWDPKENGALLIVLWGALMLHARWAGVARERGFMAMAVFGNVITALSWFGVNMLGIGLHSYGFMDKAFWWLSGFCALQFLLIGLGYLPRRFWAREAL